MLFYLYVIHFNDFYYYVGKRKCPIGYNPWNDPYSGSPKTNKNKWKIIKFTKVVIECFDNDKDVSKAETNLLLELDWENDPYCLNECCGGKFSYEANRRGAITRNKLPTKQSTREKISKRNKEMWSNPNWDKREKIVNVLKENQSRAVEASKTPESIEKRVKIFKERCHQQGEKNSQYGTKLIYNLELRQTKRIKKNEPIPIGWNKGAVYDFDAYFERQKRKEERRKNTKQKLQNIRDEKIKFYTEWYTIYQQTDFKNFCSITGYLKSQQNLCAKFKEFVKEYSPKYKNKK
tara:strand:+ start:134 stop:1006 length:873 start_codon:yes stop_codon:yes gene_type:complete